MNKKLLKAKQAFRDSVDIGSDEWSRKYNFDSNNNFMCRCDHIQSWHINGKGYCGGWKCWARQELCECRAYRPEDNLIYLEHLAKQKESK